MEEKYLIYEIITGRTSKTCRCINNTCKSIIYKHHKTKWKLFPALTLGFLYSISTAESFLLLQSSRRLFNVPFPAFFAQMLSRVHASNYMVWQDYKIQHFAFNIMGNLSENLDCAWVFLPMLFPELFLLFHLREKWNRIQKGKSTFEVSVTAEKSFYWL